MTFNLNVEYHHWNEPLWDKRKKQLGGEWQAMSEDGRRELISDLIIHAYDVVPDEKSCQLQYRKI